METSWMLELGDGSLIQGNMRSMEQDSLQEQPITKELLKASKREGETSLEEKGDKDNAILSKIESQEIQSLCELSWQKRSSFDSF